MGTAQTRRTAFIHHQNENANQGKNRKDRIKNETIRGIAKVTPINSVLTKNDYHGRACGAKGGDPHNKKHTKYEGGRNKTQRTSKDEMA